MDPAVALEQLRQLKSLGVVAAIGPQSSAEAAQVKDFADAKKLPLLIQGSTASSLVMPAATALRY